MTGKGIQAQKTYNERARRIRKGLEQPKEYTMSLKEALKAAGLN
jgi:hypothetical protein